MRRLVLLLRTLRIWVTSGLRPVPCPRSSLGSLAGIGGLPGGPDTRVISPRADGGSSRVFDLRPGRSQHVADFRCGARRAEQIALHLRAAQRLYGVALLGGFDPL